MEEDFFYQDYLNWRKSGVKSSKIKDLINLHFYFREPKKLEIKAIYQEHFSETASERESGVTEFQLFNKQTSTSDEEISLESDLLFGRILEFCYTIFLISIRMEMNLVE